MTKSWARKGLSSLHKVRLFSMTTYKLFCRKSKHSSINGENNVLFDVFKTGGGGFTSHHRSCPGSWHGDHSTCFKDFCPFAPEAGEMSL